MALLFTFSDPEPDPLKLYVRKYEGVLNKKELEQMFPKASELIFPRTKKGIPMG